MNNADRHTFHLLLEKNRQGTCTPEEEAWLQRWFEDVAMIEELTFVSVEEQEQIRKEIWQTVKAKAGIDDQAATPLRFSGLRKLWPAGIAAMLIVAVGLTWLLRPSAPAMLVVNAPGGIGKMPVRLPDSSVVWLKGGSSLSYPARFAKDSRKVQLQGTAFFMVHRDRKAPFIVKVDESISVRVLGTSFVIDEAGEQVNVDVVSGKVQVNASGFRPEVLVAGESLRNVAQGHQKEDTDTSRLKEWTGNDFIDLDNIALDDLAILMKSTYGVSLSYDRSLTNRYRFHARISRKLSLDEVLDLLGTASGLRFEKVGDMVKVQRK